MRPPCAVGSGLGHIYTTFCQVIATLTHVPPPRDCALLSRSAYHHRHHHHCLCPNTIEMSRAVKDEPRAPCECPKYDKIHIAVKSVKESKYFNVGGDCTVRQVRRPNAPLGFNSFV